MGASPCGFESRLRHGGRAERRNVAPLGHVRSKRSGVPPSRLSALKHPPVADREIEPVRPAGEVEDEDRGAEDPESDAAAALVTSTDEYGYSDPWHYDTAGYLDLGREFAKAIAKLEAAE